MTERFNFSQLQHIFLEALKSDDKTLIFESHIGRGRFLFMMFLSEEDDETKDWLFIHLRNINYILKIKMYGNHKKGTFEVYVKDEIRKKLTEELLLTPNGEEFNFYNFLTQLNSSIPSTLPVKEKIKALRRHRGTLRVLNVIDEADKTVLIGEVKLPDHKKPNDKTLRKLYTYTDGEPEEIALLISLLKKSNRTVAWTTESRRSKVTDIRSLIANIE